MRPRDWDLAPADLIISESGGYLRDLFGMHIKYGLNGMSHNGLIASMDNEVIQNIVSWIRHQGYSD